MLAATQNPVKSDRATTRDHLMDMLPETSRNCQYTTSELKTAHGLDENDATDVISLHSIESFVCRICHNSENPERFDYENKNVLKAGLVLCVGLDGLDLLFTILDKQMPANFRLLLPQSLLISPCLCKGSLTYVHSYCLERWISISRCTTCELCNFQYKTEQTLRYNFYQSLRIWYSRPMSRRALQEDCQMFLLLTLIAFGIIGTLLVAVQFYIIQGHINGLSRIWTKGWLIFFLLSTLIVYIINAYLVIRAQLLPWYRWWQTSRDIRLILESHNLPYALPRETKGDTNARPLDGAPDEPEVQRAEIEVHQKDVEAALRTYKSLQTIQAVDGKVEAACKNVLVSSEMLPDTPVCIDFENEFS